MRKWVALPAVKHLANQAQRSQHQRGRELSFKAFWKKAGDWTKKA